MNTTTILNLYQNNVSVNRIAQTILSPSKIAVKGLMDSAVSAVLSALFTKNNQPFLFLLDTKEEAAYYLNDLEQFIGKNDVLFYPSSHRRPYQIEETDNANVLLRAEVLNRINSRKKPCIIVSYPEAIFEKVVTKKELDKNTLKIQTNDNLSIDFVNETLFEYNFNRVDFVTEPGEFSVRGGILDVYSFSNDNPYRIEFFGNEIDSIRSFDVESQLSIEKHKKITIIPNVENKRLEENRENFLDYVGNKTVILIKNTHFFTQQLDALFLKATTAFSKITSELKHAKPETLFVTADDYIKKCKKKRL